MKQAMTQNGLATRVAGAWLAVASVLLTIVFVFHGPPEPNVRDQMAVIAGEPARWLVVHAMAAVALSLFAVAGLIVLGASSRLTTNGWTISAWGALPVGALWTLITAVAEATGVTNAAVAGNEAIFTGWWVFSEGMANGFAGFALCVVVIAANEARADEKATPVWASRVAAFAGIASFSAWAMWSWLDLGFAAPIWVASSILMCLWLLWFGAALVRPDAEQAVRRREAASGA
jgi:hypothetical protein